jgi:outer membrane lipoprotein carrier protein
MRTPSLLLTTFAAVGLYFAVGACVAEAQEQVTARHVAARVQSFHDQTRSFEASFVQTYYSRIYGTYTRSGGTLVFDKPGRMRFDYGAPNGKVVVADGRKLTMYEPGDEGSAGQYAQTSMREGAIPGAFSFLTGQGRLEELYTFRLLSSRTYRFSGHVLELTPRAADPRFRRVILYVDSSSERAGLVRAVRIDDHEGNRNKFEMRNMRFNRDVSAQRFAFAPPAGARRIQM